MDARRRAFPGGLKVPRGQMIASIASMTLRLLRLRPPRRLSGILGVPHHGRRGSKLEGFRAELREGQTVPAIQLRKTVDLSGGDPGEDLARKPTGCLSGRAAFTDVRRMRLQCDRAELYRSRRSLFPGADRA